METTEITDNVKINSEHASVLGMCVIIIFRLRLLLLHVLLQLDDVLNRQTIVTHKRHCETYFKYNRIMFPYF
jgi:hypothetical protein